MTLKDEAPAKLRFELVRDVAGETDPVVIKAKMIKKTDEVIFFPRMKPMPRAYFVESVIKRDKQVKRFFLLLIPRGTKTVTEYIVRCNAYSAESLKGLTEKPEYSVALANLLLSDDEKQHIEGVASLKKFVLDETLLKLILIVFAISVPFGFFMDAIVHLVPSQIIVWGP